MMETRARFVLIGLFTVLGFVAGLGVLLWLAKVQIDRTYAQYEIVFDTVAGLSETGAVRYNGVDVGKVEVIRLLEDVARLKERVGDLQKHFGAVAVDLEKLSVSADKITRRGARIESVDLEEEADVTRPKLVERG